MSKHKPRSSSNKASSGRIKRPTRQEGPSRLQLYLVRTIPLWVLLAMILILAPSLPSRVFGLIFRASAQVEDEPAETEPAEPVFVVEGAALPPDDDELPPPSWSLDVSPVFTDTVRSWSEEIEEWSVAYRIKPNLIATIMQIGSCGNPDAVSSTGAQGLFQVGPEQFSILDDPFDPDTNARKGLLYFSDMYAVANGDLGEAFAAYSVGPWAIGASPADWPEETQRYQFWATGIYEEAELGLDHSPTLGAWLDAGGAALCEQAAEARSLN